MMFLNARLIFSLLGLFFAGLPGGVFGFLLGWWVDHHNGGNIFTFRGFSTKRAALQSTFFKTTFQILGYIAKADGRVSHREIRTAEDIMRHLDLDELQRAEAIEYFRQGKQPDFNWQAALQQLKQKCLFQPSLLKTFLEFQLQMGQANGQISSASRHALENVFHFLGVRLNFSQSEQSYRSQSTYRSQRSSLGDAYSVLGVSANASQGDVKKAYRRLMSENHPDKLIAKGVPESMIKLATEKTQKIKQAYEDICRAKGWT